MFLRVPETLGKSTTALKGELFAKDSTVPGWGTITDPDGDCRVHFDGSNLTITVPNKGPHLLDQGKQKLNAPRLLQPMEGDFTAEVRFQAFPPPLASTSAAQSGGPFVSAGLLILQDDRNFIRWERAVVDGTSIRLRMEMIVAGKSSYRQEWDIFDPNTSLLVERIGTKFSFKTKAALAAGVWSGRYVTSLAMSQKLKVGVFAVNNTTKELTALLQGFKLTALGPNQAVAASTSFTNGMMIPQYGTVVDPDGDCQFVVNNGTALTINVPKVAHDLMPMPDRLMLNAPRVLKNVAGDFVASTTVNPISKPVAKASSTGRPGILAAGLLIWQDDKNFIRWERVAIDAKEERLRLQHYEAGSNKLDKEFESEGDAIPLQVERNGNQFLFRGGSTAGGFAKVLHVATLELPARLKIGVHATNTTGADFTPEFQSFVAFSETDAKKVTRFSTPPPGTFPLLPMPDLLDLAKKPAPADAFKRSDIPAEVLAKLRTGARTLPRNSWRFLAMSATPKSSAWHLPPPVAGSRLAACALAVPNCLTLQTANSLSRLTPAVRLWIWLQLAAMAKPWPWPGPRRRPCKCSTRPRVNLGQPFQRSLATYLTRFSALTERIWPSATVAGM